MTEPVSNPVALDRLELTRALQTLSSSLHRKRGKLHADLQGAITRIDRGEDATRVGFDLGTEYRELRVLGGLLQSPAERRAEMLAVEGRLLPAQASELLPLVATLEQAPNLVDALAWVMPPWFVSQPKARTRTARAPLVVLLHVQPDAPFAAELEAHLRPSVEHEGLLDVWSPRMIAPGEHVQSSLMAHVEGAHLLVCLLSADFVASRSLYPLVKTALARGQRVLPVLLRPVDLAGLRSASLLCVPRSGVPVASAPSRDAAWVEVVEAIREAAGTAPAPRLVPQRLVTQDPGQDPARPLFTWVHLSDLHVGHADAAHCWDQGLVLQALRSDLHRLVQGGSVPAPNAVLVTGDVAFSGGGRRDDEYPRAREYLAALAGDLGLSMRRHVFVVPGNHDVDRSVQGRSLTRLLRNLRDGSESLDDALSDPDDLALLQRRLTNYLELAKDCACGARLFWVERLLQSQGLKIRLVGFNTALLAAGDDDRGRLRLGKRALALALLDPAPEPEELVLTLSHHPFRGGWLADEREIDAWVRNSAHLHLSGHIHDAESEVTRTGGGGVFVRISGGAVHSESGPSDIPAGHGYNLGAIFAQPDRSLKVRVWPRRWSESSKAFRVDVDNTPDGAMFAEHSLRLALNDRSPAPPAFRPSDRATPGPDDHSQPVDFLILAPLEEERNAVLSKLPGHELLEADGRDVHAYFQVDLPTRRKDSAVYRIIVTSPAFMGPTHAAITAAAVAARWKPAHVLVVGIAGGLKDEAALGDVMVASSVADYGLGKVERGRREERWEMFPADMALLQRTQVFATGWEDLIAVPRPEVGAPRRHVGVIASGGDVIASPKLIATYRRDMPKLIGCEMEGGGVAAALLGDLHRPRFLMIRGVSDLADSEGNAATKRVWRAYARDVAAAYAIGLLRSGPVPAVTPPAR